MKLTANPAWLSLPPNLGKGSGAKFLRIMKLTTIIILAACLHTSAKGVAQQTITFSGKEVSLEYVFNAIKKQTNYRFFFNTDMLTNASKVTLDVKNAQVEQVMNMALKDQPLTFTIKGRTIFVMKKPEEEKKSTQLAPTGDPITVSGRVTDENGEPLAGANVKVKGGNNGVTTDGQGRFTLNNVDPNASLEISFVGRETQMLSVKGKTVFSVALGQKTGILDETVVIAYGTTTKRLNTGNVSTVKYSDIQKQPVNNPILALQGRVPGMTITQSSGISGSAVNIRIQGRNNLNTAFTGSDPLIVIDGVPYPSQNLMTFASGSGTSKMLGGAGGSFSAAGSTLSFLNPADIESIDVLKDADATSIYGSRAANGALLITTKKGKAGNTKIDINVQHGFGEIDHQWKMLNLEQYMQMRKEAKQNDNAALSSTDYDLNGLWDTTKNTNWQEELIGKRATYSRASATISGGNSIMNYLVGTTYARESSVFPGDFASKKGSLHFNINSLSLDKRFNMQLSGSFLADNNNIPGIDFTRFISLAPVAPDLYNSDGTLNWAIDANGNSTWLNPLSYNYNIFENKSYNLIGNLLLGYQILPGLELKTSLGYNQLSSNQFLASLDASFAPEKRAALNRSATFSNNMIHSWIVEPQLNYNRNFGSGGKLNLLVGASFQDQTSNGTQTEAAGQSSDQLLRNLAAATSYGQFTINSVYRYNAIFGRINYTLYDRYLVNLTGRRDGSSRFGSNNQLHNFGAIGVGWIFSEERLFKKYAQFLSFGKVKGSYGVTGNDQIGDYQFMSLYSTTTNLIPYQSIRGLQAGTLSNPDLQWEETRKLQGSIELGFLRNRLMITATYFRNRTNNTLTSVNLPIITGFTVFNDNFPALIQNTGWEFTLRTENIKSTRFSWTTNFNLTIPKNKLVSFPGLEFSSSANELVVGQPLSITKSYSFYGIDPQTGVPMFKDFKGNITSSPNSATDLISIMNNAEKFVGGLQNVFTYNGVQLDILLQFTKQKGKNYFYTGVPGRFTTTILGNQPITVLQRWQNPGDITAYPRYTTLSSNTFPEGDRFFADASFVRVKNVALSYQMPQSISKQLHINECRFFINAQNLFTFTSYQGLDPETMSITSLPPLRVVTFGVQLTL